MRSITCASQRLLSRLERTNRYIMISFLKLVSYFPRSPFLCLLQKRKAYDSVDEKFDDAIPNEKVYTFPCLLILYFHYFSLWTRITSLLFSMLYSRETRGIQSLMSWLTICLQVVEHSARSRSRRYENPQGRGKHPLRVYVYFYKVNRSKLTLFGVLSRSSSSTTSGLIGTVGESSLIWMRKIRRREKIVGREEKWKRWIRCCD